MTKKTITITEATKQWVGEFNAISESLISRAFKNEPENLTELTGIRAGEYVYSGELDGSFEVIRVENDGQTIVVNNDGEEFPLDADEVEQEKDSWLPMWSTLWSFGNSFDEDWAKENVQLVTECGFRIYEDEETGDIFLGIDGAGYDFYEAHWIPLYRARGLEWHTEDEFEPKKDMIQVTNDSGVTFNVRIKKSDTEGRDSVNFYDTRYDFTEYGQFVTSYYAFTLLEGGDYSRGLSLDAGVETWDVSSENMKEILEWLRK